MILYWSCLAGLERIFASASSYAAATSMAADCSAPNEAVGVGVGLTVAGDVLGGVSVGLDVAMLAGGSGNSVQPVKQSRVVVSAPRDPYGVVRVHVVSLEFPLSLEGGRIRPPDFEVLGLASSGGVKRVSRGVALSVAMKKSPLVAMCESPVVAK